MQKGLSVTLWCLWWWQPLFYLCKPVVEIDGVAHPCKWGTHFFALPPGWHRIRIFSPYLMQKECGLALTDIEVQPNHTVSLSYYSPFTILNAGRLKMPA